MDRLVYLCLLCNLDYHDKHVLSLGIDGDISDTFKNCTAVVYLLSDFLSVWSQQ